MSGKAGLAVIGRGAPELDLSHDELRYYIERSLIGVASGVRVLAVIPDKTRDDNTDLLFPIAAKVLASRGVARLDALVAQGTHAPMSEQQKRAKIGASEGLPGLGQIFDHRWDCSQELITLGELKAEQVSRLTDGLINHNIPVRLNRLLAPGLYDLVLIFGATTPHEVAGFSGGAKYFFPGIAGPDLTHATHWLGALAGIEHTIGRIETPIRHLIEAAADLIPARVISFTSVVTRDGGRLRTHALFAGDFREAFRQAAEVSRRVHIKYTGRRYKRVVALLDEHYDEMWVGGKASYRLGGIIEEGGELIIYAPHLGCLSRTHGQLIEHYGYAPLEIVRKFVAESAELQANLCVAAHLAHVVYAGRRDEDGRIVPRYQITLASQIDEQTCRRVNLGYLDYRKFHCRDYESDPDTLIVERAGCDLYLVEPGAASIR
jgi:nickel-dependent lactate racemase